MTELEKRLLNTDYNLIDGTHLDVEIYKSSKEDENISLHISHNGSSGVVYYNKVKNTEDIGRYVSDYVDRYM